MAGHTISVDAFTKKKHADGKINSRVLLQIFLSTRSPYSFSISDIR